jgi:ABC-type antimicrobial peptide transport system permease subunit
MRSFWSLIPRSILKNKKRVFFIAVGIILSMSLIISLSIMVEALKKSSYQSMVDDAGGIYDILFYTSDKKGIEKLTQDPILDKISISANLGTYNPPKTNYILEINGYEKNICELVNFKLLDGRCPENDNEIAIEEWMLKYMSKKYKIGDKISLTSILKYSNVQGKTEEIKNEDEFTLVGTFEYKFNSNGEKNKATAYVTKKYVEAVLPQKLIKYCGYVTLNSSYPIEKGAQFLMSTSEYENIYFRMNYIKTFILKSLKVLNFASVVLFIIISIVASIIIYNIFNVSVMERIRDFGMLRALGASPGKIKALVLGEGLILGCVFIPLGIIIGNFLVKAAIASVSGYKDFGGIMSIPPNGIVASFIIGFLTIIMGVYSPARKASKISPMEAINSNNNLQLEGTKVKQNLRKQRIIDRIFGFAGNMAYLNLSRNRKRYLTTVVSLGISIIVFMLVSFLINSVDPIKSVRNKMGTDFIISSTLSKEEYSVAGKDVESIRNMIGIEEVNVQKNLLTTLEVPGTKITQEGMKFLKSQSNKTPKARSDFQQKIYNFNVNVLGYESDDLNSLKEHLQAGEVDIEAMNIKPIAILGQNLNYSNNTVLKVGDEIKISFLNYDGKGNYISEELETFVIGGLLKDNYMSTDIAVKNIVIVSNIAADKYLNLKGYQQVKVSLNKNGNYDEVKKSLENTLNNYRNISLKSYKEELEKAKKQYLQLTLIMYSFVIIVAIVSIINLLNIMSMNVILRKREIGMLRSLGFGNDEVKKMIRIEGLFYGLSSSIGGAGLGTVLSYLLFLISRKTLVEGMAWKFPTITIAMIFMATTFICLLGSVNASKRVFSSSIVESVRTLE